MVRSQKNQLLVLIRCEINNYSLVPCTDSRYISTGTIGYERQQYPKVMFKQYHITTNIKSNKWSPVIYA